MVKTVTPDMKLDKQVRKATFRIRNMLDVNTGDGPEIEKAKYTLGLIDQMVASFCNGQPRPWSEFSPMIDEEFG